MAPDGAAAITCEKARRGGKKKARNPRLTGARRAAARPTAKAMCEAKTSNDDWDDTM